MKINQIVKVSVGTFALAAMAMLSACSTSPVREELVTSSYEVAPLAESRTVRTIEPVAEEIEIPASNSCF